MEYLVDCPHCQNRFKVLIPIFQGELYTTNCPKCNLQFTFRISQIPQYQMPPQQQFQPYQQMQYPQQIQIPLYFKKPSNYTTVGILLTISALIGYMVSAVFFMYPDVLGLKSPTPEITVEDIMYSSGIINAIFSSFTLVGGIASFTGRHEGIIIVGSIHGILSIIFNIVSALISISALILFYKIKKENEVFDF